MEGESALTQEREHLNEILRITRDQLRAAEEKCARRGTVLAEARREMREQSSALFQNLWSAQDFEALASLNQYTQPLSIGQRAEEMEEERIRMLRGMLDAPYFARIDIDFDDGDSERVYIGRATLKDESTHEIFVHDWRSPVAGVFYRFGTGRMQYDAPGGRITGTVTLKRQFEIQNGVLRYFFDADVEVQDRFLRGMLAQGASPRMRAIVETIQRDQDAAIRDTDHELLMVQGAAGSGKSSIALHRVAFLMYRGLSSPLEAGDILILSPNALFECYIRQVLPELGEKNVRTATLEQLLEEVLGTPVELRSDRLERMSLAENAGRARLREALGVKSSRVFREILDRFVRELPRRWIEFEDVCYGRHTIATRQQLKARILASEGAIPLGVRLRRMEMSLWDGIHQRRPARMTVLTGYARRDPRHGMEITACARSYSILECAILSRQIRRFAYIRPLALYRRMTADEFALRRLCRGLSMPAGAEELLKSSGTPTRGALPLEDAAAAAYIKLATEGEGRLARIRHVVVDEAQDYTPMEYALLKRLFPRAHFTVLGDVNQALEHPADRGLYRQVAAALNHPGAPLIELNKSFRCTREILSFALGFLREAGEIECFSRGGDAPAEHKARDPEEMKNLISSEIRLCRERGYKSIALIAQTARDARAWHARLAEPGLTLISAEEGSEMLGAFVIPLALSKGLEFDAVLVLDADRWAADGDNRRLYVACTRALHRLNLYVLGDGMEARKV